METSVACYSRGILLLQRLFSTIIYIGFSSFILLCIIPLQGQQRLKSSSLFGDSQRLAPRSQLKATKAKNNGTSTVTKCEIGQSLEEFLRQATPDKRLKTLLMCMGEALRTVAFKVMTASCGGTACVNSFGDEQLAVDMLADKLLFEALQYSHVCKYACSEEVPELQDMGGPVEGGFSVSFDPLDGSSIVDTNFTVGTIFGVWTGDELTGVTGGDQMAAAMGIYGPRTTYVLAVKGFRELMSSCFLMKVNGSMLRRQQRLMKGKMFSPGNLRTTSDACYTFSDEKDSKTISFIVSCMPI